MLPIHVKGSLQNPFICGNLFLIPLLQTRQKSHDLGAQRGEQIPNQYQVDALIFEISQDLNFS